MFPPMPVFVYILVIIAIAVLGSSCVVSGIRNKQPSVAVIGIAFGAISAMYLIAYRMLGIIR